MKKTNEEKLSLLLNDERLLSEQRELLIQWQQHIRKCTELSKVLERAYTITEFSIFLRRPLNEATTKDIQTFLQQKSSNVKETTIKNYKFRLQGFYRWIIKHTKYKIDEELAYPKPIVVTKIEVSREEMCKQRVKKILDNKQKPKLNDTNLQTLNDYHNYKITSGKVESYTGFVGKVYFLKRLGLFLGEKNYKEVKREDIQNFLSNVQSKINVSYKAHLLDFYRFVYSMFGEEQPRKYPEVVSWLYQGRKKRNDKIPKEIIPDEKIKQMINASIELRDKALIALMADCSARVGEITNICIKDLKINEVATESQYKHLIATVTLRGKTGERTNQLFYSVPYLRLWLLNHPLIDNPDAPLFIASNPSRYGQRLSAVGINKILQRAGKRAEIKRHIHAHLFRHTNLTRMARVLSESELKIHAGWGTDSNMASVYVHLNEKDVANKLLEKWGIRPKEEKAEQELMQVQICANTICSYQNPCEAKFCLKCGYPLSLKTAIGLKKLKEKEERLHQEIINKGTKGLDLTNANNLKETMYQIVKNDERLLDILQSIATEAISLEEGAQ